MDNLIMFMLNMSTTMTYIILRKTLKCSGDDDVHNIIFEIFSSFRNAFRKISGFRNMFRKISRILFLKFSRKHSGIRFQKDPENRTDFQIFQDLFHNGNRKYFRYISGWKPEPEFRWKP